MSRALEPAPTFVGMRTVNVVRDETGRVVRYDVASAQPPEAEPEALGARLRWLARQTPRGWPARQSPRAADNRRRLEEARRSANPPGVAANRKRLAAVR